MSAPPSKQVKTSADEQSAEPPCEEPKSCGVTMTDKTKDLDVDTDRADDSGNELRRRDVTGSDS